MLETVDGLELTTDIELLGSTKEVLDTGVGVVVGAKDELGLVDPGGRGTVVSLACLKAKWFTWRANPMDTYLSGL